MTLPWYPRDMGKYARDTKQLSILEHGAYTLMLDYYYSTGGLPQAVIQASNATSNATLMPDHSRIYRVCTAMTKAEQDAVDFVLKTFFKMNKQGFYTQQKCDEIIAEQEEKHENRVRAGKQAKLKHCSSNTPQTKTKTKKESPLPPKGEAAELQGLSSTIREGVKFNIDLHLNDADRDRAREAAPGWDLNGFLMPAYNEGINSGDRPPPNRPAAAFIAWCKSYTKGQKP